jgi:hypothetical protein
MSDKKFKYLDAARQSDLNRLLQHTVTTYGLSAMLEQLIDLTEGPRPYEKSLVADLKKTLATYEKRSTDFVDQHGIWAGTDDFPDDYEFDK